MPKGVDLLKPGTKAFEVRQQRHRHNSFFGYARMIQMQANTIQRSASVTLEAARLASDIEHKAILLAQALKTRVDP